MMKRLVLFAFATVALTVSASAFDHHRKGFVLGMGVGFSPNASWETDPYYLPKNTGHTGFGAHGLIGFGRNEHDLLASEWNVVWYDSPTGLIPSGSVSVLQWLWALSWYHYYGTTGKSLYTVIGVGPYFLTPAWSKLTEFGGAILLGAGYEFVRHAQIGVYYSVGKVFNVGLNGPSPNDYHSHHVSVLLTVVGY